MNSETIITIADFMRLKQMLRQVRRGRRRGTYPNALERELRRAAIVPIEGIPRDAVTMNSRLRIRDAESGVRDTVSVVYPHHADWEQGDVPVLGALGTALLGTRVGDVVRQWGTSGIQAWEIEKLLYQPEAAGDYHL